MSVAAAATPLEMAAAVLPGTPAAIVERYATLAQRAETRSFGLIEDDVIVLDTETTGLSHRDSCLLYTSPSPRDLYTSRMPSSA